MLVMKLMREFLMTTLVRRSCVVISVLIGLVVLGILSERLNWPLKAQQKTDLLEDLELNPGTASTAAAMSAVASNAPVASATVGDGSASEHERLVEELSMAKALLMLNNVSLSMDLERTSRPTQNVHLKGNAQLIRLLVTLKQKVSLLYQQYLLLRGDLVYLNHEMNACRQWVLQSFRMAMQRQTQEHHSLQTRFERLSKALA